MRTITEALEELSRYAEDVRRASHRTAQNALRRYVATLDADPLGDALRSALPVVDFDAWHFQTLGTIKSMVGSGRLTWPTDLRPRVALQAELLRRIASDQIDLVSFTYDFHYVRNSFDANIAAFVEQEFRPFDRDVRLLLQQAVPAAPSVPPGASVVPAPVPATIEYIANTRITELKAVQSSTFDLRKLIRLCEEIDSCFRAQNYLAVAALTRAVIDHVPPIFGFKAFSEVANNYAGGGKSFRESMQNLSNSARKIGDAHLHVQIRNSESLPTSTQVNFSNDLDVLLGEIVRVLR
jgi:hypothetical protein